MLTEHNIITFKGKVNNTICEINLPKRDNDLMKLSIGKEESYIKIKDFYKVCLLLVKNKQIERLFPIVERKVKKYKRQIKVLATKDIKKGEEIVVTYEIDVNSIIADNIEKNAKRNL